MPNITFPQNLNYYQVNGSADYKCGACQESIVSQQEKKPIKALGHKQVNQKYIQKVIESDKASEKLGDRGLEDTFAQIFHQVVKDNPKLMKDRIPKDYFHKSETISCFFHPQCIKTALSSSSQCPSCQTKLEPPKNLLSYREKWLQKIRETGRKISPYCSLSALKKAVQGGCEGALKGAQLAASIAITRLSGISENLDEDLKALLFSKNRPSSSIRGFPFLAPMMLCSHFLLHLLPEGEATEEAAQQKLKPIIEEHEKQLTAPGVSQAEKLRLADEIETLKSRLGHSKEFSFALARGALLATMLGTTCLAATIPGGLTAAALGVLIGGIPSSRQFHQILDHGPKVAERLSKPMKKIFIPIFGGLFSAAIAHDAGLPVEGQAILGGLGAGVASSFL